MIEVLQKYGFVKLDESTASCCGGPKTKWMLPGTTWYITEFSRSKNFIVRHNRQMLYKGKQIELDEYIQTRIVTV